MCNYCNLDNLHDNEILKNEYVSIAITKNGYLEIATNDYSRVIKIEYCPFCGRKLNSKGEYLDDRSKGIDD